MFALRTKQGSKTWEAMREKLTRWISSTEGASLFHASHYTSRRALFQRKIGLKKKYVGKNPAIEHGKKFEEHALEKAKELLDLKFWEESLDWRRPGIVLDPWSVFSCSPDQICQNFGLEVKCPWKRALPEKKEDILNDYLLQCFICCHVCKLPSWYLFYLEVTTGRHHLFHVRENRELWERLKRKGGEFVDLLEAGDLKEGLRSKRKSDGEEWEEVKKELLLGVSRVC